MEIERERDVERERERKGETQNERDGETEKRREKVNLVVVEGELIHVQKRKKKRERENIRGGERMKECCYDFMIVYMFLHKIEISNKQT